MTKFATENELNGLRGTVTTNTSSITTAFQQSQSDAGFAVMQRLKFGSENLVITILGDSTGVVPAASTGWVAGFCAFLATSFPAYAVNQRNWNDGGQVYDAATVIQAGTGTGNAGGPFVIDVYNGSVSGSAVAYPITTYARWNLMTAVAPNLVIFNYGHNSTGATTGYGTTHYTTVRAVQMAFPKAGIIQMMQNPRAVVTSGEGANHLIRMREVMDLARELNYGVINITQPYLDNPTYATDWMNVDAVHPNALGISAVYLPAIQGHFNFANNLVPQSQANTENRIYIPADAFTIFSGVPVLGLINSDINSWGFPMAADSEIVCQFSVPSYWTGFDLFIQWQAPAFAAANKVAWRTLTRQHGLGPTTAGLNTSTFASGGWTNNQAGSVVSGASNVGAYANCGIQMITNAILGSSPYGLRVKRSGTDATNDTYLNTANFIGVYLIRSR